MMRSMFAGVSGLRNHQIRLDVIGNNIANVNTVGYKSSRANFQEVFYQTIRGASSAQDQRGGTNPQQIGLGMSISSIDTLHTQGNLQTTGKMTDLAVQGNGFFILNQDGQFVYTRAGTFDRDASGYLINPANGLKVMGWMADANGVFPIKDHSNLTTIQIPVGTSIPGKATTKLAYSQNLNADTAVSGTYTTSVTVYDSLGRAHDLTMTFAKTDANSWSWTADWAGAAGAEGTGTLTFNPDGSYNTSTSGPIAFTPAGANALSITVDLSDVTQYAATKSTVSARERDGYPMGSLNTFTIDATGTVTGVYSNGLTQKIAQVALANFSNPGGLIKKGDSLYEDSNNSGLRQIGEPGTGSRGVISPGTLEMSNVDLSQEFTEMIVTQRGFQANSRIITTSDEMLQELVNLKR